MSQLARSFNRALHNELTIYAAWYPVANTIKLGDFGLIEDGVFRALGNISEFNAHFNHAAGESASIDFRSRGATAVRMVGGSKVDSYPEVGNVEATLSFNFENANSCLIKGMLSVMAMQNIYQVAKKLKEHDSWERRFRVVSATYTSENIVIIATSESDTKVEFSATVDALKQVELGKVEAKVGIQSTKEKVFMSVGKSGVVGLRLFKLGIWGGVKVLGNEDTAYEEQWGEDLEDDL
ncbi:hypothetical protein C6A37_05965 [Desulfobacteraceae bacterium SEEP-SAG9]|nr:hypothetical protein C6A37_05965 [Desulfobacteraceae bacterium SEEP-SAG9]